MNSFPRILFCLLAFFIIEGSQSFARAESKGKPNIVFLLADDLGWTGLGCYGSDFYETPNLDRLAARGMKFTDAYAACTVCSPTRASILTGAYPARLHLTDFIAGQNRPFAKMKIPDWTKVLESKHVTIAEALQKAGYRTGHVGKWHLESKRDRASARSANDSGAISKGKGSLPLAQGFDVSYRRPAKTKGYLLPGEVKSKAGTNYLTDYLTDRACEFIDQSRAKPFFLCFAYHVPHTPIQGRADLVKKFEGKVDPKAIHKNPVYAAMVASLDQSVGRVMKQLEESGVAGNTVVIFTSDNGGLTQRYGKHDGFTENFPLRRGKGSAYEGGVRVPAIVRYPGVTEEGSLCQTPIMTIDYFPTIAEMAGVVGTPAGNNGKEMAVDGVSLLPQLKDAKASIERALFWHYPHYHAGGDGPYSAIRSGSERLIEFHEDRSLRLYDLAKDSGETTDLSVSKPERTRQLHKQLQDWREAVGAQMPTANPAHDPEKSEQVKRR